MNNEVIDLSIEISKIFMESGRIQSGFESLFHIKQVYESSF